MCGYINWYNPQLACIQKKVFRCRIVILWLIRVEDPWHKLTRHSVLHGFCALLPPSHRHTNCAHITAEFLPESFKAGVGVIFPQNLWELKSALVWTEAGLDYTEPMGIITSCVVKWNKHTKSPNRPVFSWPTALPCLYFLLKGNIF